jgi:hypothetical protein
MPTVNVAEPDFSAVARAAQEAEDRGDHEAAAVLDKLARKINASLSNATGRKASSSHPFSFFHPGTSLRWQDIPSTLRSQRA